MKTEKRKNSALKKLIPAVAMLATSAVMLSTATYAWFTMNKEVKMTGLNMTATVGEGIEIALAQKNSDGLTFRSSNTALVAPDDNSSESWNSAVVVGNYYELIGKLKPVSSIDGVSFFEATDASNSGKVADTYVAIDVTDKYASTGFDTMTTERGTFSDTTTVGTGTQEGYYVDIPVHIRTTKIKSVDKESGEIQCKIKINDATPDDVKNNLAQGDTPELYKSIRVAFIGLNGGTFSNICSNNNLIFGATKDCYRGDYVAVKAAGTGDTARQAANLTEATIDSDADVSTLTAQDTGLVLPFAESSGKYGHLDFIVRVWVEGESTFCNDDEAGQSWNIDLAFSLKEEPTTP